MVTIVAREIATDLPGRPCRLFRLDNRSGVWGSQEKNAIRLTRGRPVFPAGMTAGHGITLVNTNSSPIRTQIT